MPSAKRNLSTEGISYSGTTPAEPLFQILNNKISLDA